MAIKDTSGKPVCYCDEFPIKPHSHITTEDESSDIRPDLTRVMASETLQQKLREILEDCAESFYPMHEYPDQPIFTDQNKVTLDEAIAQIVQAFESEGWIPLAYNPAQQTVAGKPIAPILKISYDLMTGQEFYERFKAELYKPKEQEYKVGTFTDDEKKARFYRDGGTNFMYQRALEAARRAAGILEKQEET